MQRWARHCACLGAHPMCLEPKYVLPEHVILAVLAGWLHQHGRSTAGASDAPIMLRSAPAGSHAHSDPARRRQGRFVDGSPFQAAAGSTRNLTAEAGDALEASGFQRLGGTRGLQKPCNTLGACVSLPAASYRCVSAADQVQGCKRSALPRRNPS